MGAADPELADYLGVSAGGLGSGGHGLFQRVLNAAESQGQPRRRARARSAGGSAPKPPAG